MNKERDDEKRTAVTIMLLAIDIGNTQTVFGIYENGVTGDVSAGNGACDDTGAGGGDLRDAAGDGAARLAPAPLHMWRIATNREDAADDVRLKLLGLFGAAQIDLTQITNVVMASVVPLLTGEWTSAVRDMTGRDVQMCTARAATAAGLFDAAYPRPDEIGADRVADAIAARVLFGAPVAVVDFGTATNIEVVDAQGRFVGGIIAAGVKTAADALFAQAMLLKTIDFETPLPHDVIGTSSEEALRSGIIYGEADRVDGLLRRVFAQLGQTCPVVATGGLASLIAPYSSEITAHLDELTLVGLRLLASS